MDNYQQTLSGADARQLFLENQVTLFLFDLKNEACEHGFKIEESWFLQLATDEELTALRRDHHPLITVRLGSDILLKVFQQVKQALRQALDKSEASLTAQDLSQGSIRHLVAYRRTRNN
ncbi:MAG TPA: hypothetical protein VHB54_17895 [Mucilaginibacter sp.]|nr:hypothetical protein [Mucilaginibacter sp.]